MGLKYRKTAQIQINTKRKYTKRRMGTIGRTIGVYVCGEADQEVKIDREREREKEGAGVGVWRIGKGGICTH